MYLVPSETRRGKLGDCSVKTRGLHGQTGRFMVCVNGSQSSGLVNFVPEIAFNICTNQSHLPENGREGLKLVSISVWNIPSGNFRCSVAPGNFPLGRPKKSFSIYPPTGFPRKIFVNGKQLPLPRWQGFLVLLPTMKLLFCIKASKEKVACVAGGIV